MQDLLNVLFAVPVTAAVFVGVLYFLDSFSRRTNL